MKNDLEKFFAFFREAEKLKSVLRRSFMTSGRQESSAEHSWRLALMVFIFAGELSLDINISRAMKIAIVHDLPETIAGDVDTVDIHDGKITKEEKNKRENEAMEKLKEILPQEIGEDIYGLWDEYENAATKEARYVKALDKIECLTQLVEAGYKIYDRPELIAPYADEAVKNFPELLPALRIVKRKLKEEFIKGGFQWKEEYDKV